MPRSRRPATVSAKRRSSASSASGICSSRSGSAELGLAEAGRPLDRRPDAAPLAGCRAQQPERVRGDSAGGRGEGAEQRLVVERVGERRQQRADVGDLLLGPVAAAADDVGAQAGPLQRVLVGVEMGERSQQYDHLAAVDPDVGQLSQPLGEGARLGQAVKWRRSVDRRFQVDPLRVPAVAGGEQQLDRGSRRRRERRRRASRRRAAARKHLAPSSFPADRVDRADQLRPRAEVAAQLHRLCVGALFGRPRRWRKTSRSAWRKP